MRLLDPDSLEILPAIGVGRLKAPHDATFDPRGGLFVADSNNHRIEVIGPDRQLVPIVGDGEPRASPARFNRPEGVEVSWNRLWSRTARTGGSRRSGSTDCPNRPGPSVTEVSADRGSGPSLR